MQFTSGIVEQAVEALSGFPGIGKRSALRMVMYLLNRPEHEVVNLADSILKIKTELKLCRECGNVSDNEVCNVCSNPSRNTKIICVVEDFSDQMSIESTAQFNGVYHVLGGLISPMDGIGPDQLLIQALLDRVEKNAPEEIIMAFSATVEGDTTMFYLAKKLRDMPVRVSCISRGIAIGGEIGYADEITLGRSIANRTEYKV
ncbi:MAG: recombination protein RecR [Sphingomonadales bacterium]|nr:recombination protein RecR [Sphingomonadales bacterium]